ncbi:unnamed protein product, partial [Brassica oleracea]
MENLRLPERMFAYGEEPNGERVNTYHKPKRIETILDALDPEEVEFFRNRTFGKIISQAENPSFSELVEMIRDLEEFLAFPWGRVAFEMLVTGIKKKDEILLSQTSVALPGFLDAIQLVFMEAVPQIKEVVPQPEP